MLYLTIKQLKAFEVVARHLNFSRAADALYLSQPAVSMQIRQLEESIGLPLLERQGKRLFLTEAGHETLRYCRAILQQLQDLESTLGEIKGLERGRLTIAVVSTASYFISQILAKFIREHPQIHVTLTVANRDTVIRQMTDHIADIAIMGQPPDEAELVSEPFMDNPLVVIAAPDHPLAQQKKIPITALAKETFLLRERGSGTRGVVERFFTQHRLPLPAHLEMDTNEAIKQSVNARIGIGIISRHGIDLELETNRLRVLDAAEFPIMRHWHIVHRKDNRLSIAARAFQDFLLREVEKIATTGRGKKRK
ncbi:MAG: LysR family transcriptional regulator [Methylobacillus sp.]|jgi:DNA-binding transcriptional LysR family regulator|nr:LysR family transcriptional regulator [Methylobacillus sp.]